MNVTPEWLLERGFIFVDRHIKADFAAIHLTEYYSLSINENGLCFIYFKFPDDGHWNYNDEELGIGVYFDFMKRIIHTIPVSRFLDDIKEITPERVESLYLGLTGKALEKTKAEVLA